MKNLISTVFKGAAVADKFHESGQERQATLTERHKNDMLSDNWLSKSIRPLSVLVLLSVVCIMGLGSLFGLKPDPVIMGELIALLMTAFGFYFQSRKNEKVAAENAKANIELEKIKVKASTKIEKKEAKRERRNARRAERKQDKED